MESIIEFLTMDNLFTLLGGLGLFLFGIKMMGEALKALAGDNLRELINKYTSNKFSAVLVGCLATIAIQSSSGTSALTISLVRAGLMDLAQAIGVIMGANIGTTVTAFLLGLKIKAFALPIIFVGSTIYLFSQKPRSALKGQIIFGFGLLFYGMVVMETPLKALAATDGFEALMHQVATTPLLGVLIGAGLTMLVQSSSATIGILQGLYLTGMVSFPIAFSILIGDNIGTTITSLLASIGGSRDSQRAAFSHVFFNIFGSILFFIIMYVFGFIDLFGNFIMGLTDNMGLQIAFSHMFFNFTVMLILVWFVDQIKDFVCFLVPDSKEVASEHDMDNYFDESLIHESPSLALEQAKRGVVELSTLTIKQFDHVIEYVNTLNEKEFTAIEEFELGINALDKQLKGFLRDLTSGAFSDEADLQRINGYMYSINDLERIGDLAVNISSKFANFSEKGETLSEESLVETNKMLQVARSIIRDINDLVEHEDIVVSGKIFEKEKHLDRMERKYYKAHLKRVKENICQGRLSISYVDFLSDIERIGDHGQNIGEYFANTDQVLSEEELEVDLTTLLARD